MHNKNLLVSLVQFDIAWEDKKANLQHLDTLFNSIDNTDLIVLPETFSTGFSMNTPQITEDFKSGDTIGWMQHCAKIKKTVLCGSISVSEKNSFYNRFVFVDKNRVEYYNKRHLFCLTKEDKVYTKGSKHLLFKLNNWIICPFICYDLRFPVWSRNTMNYDLLIYTANWPSARKDAWTTLLKARAIENQAYVVGINRTGNDGNNITYSGGSIVYSPMGEVFADLGTSGTCVKTVELDYSYLHKIRRQLPFLADRDNFTIE